MIDGNWIRSRVDEVMVPVVTYVMSETTSLAQQITTINLDITNINSTITTNYNSLTTTINNDIAGLASIYAPINSPVFTGVASTTTPIVSTDDSNNFATTAFVVSKIAAATTGVSSVLGSTGSITLTELTAGGVAPLASPVFTGTPTLTTTPAAGDNSTSLASTAFVTNAITTAIDTLSPVGTNKLLGTTLTAGVTTTIGLGTDLILSGGVLSVNPYVLPTATATVLGGVQPDGTTLTNTSGALSVTYGTVANTAAEGNDSRIVGALQTNTAAATYATIVSPALSGTPTAPTPAAGNNSTSIATTAYVNTADLAALANAIPVSTNGLLGGSATAGVADFITIGTNLSLVGNVLNALAYTLPTATATVLGGVKPDGTTLTNTSGALSVTYGTVANTAAQGNDTRIVGALQQSTAATTYAPLASPTFTGTPLAPTQAATDNSTKLSTTAYVTTAVTNVYNTLYSDITNETNRAQTAEATKGTLSVSNTWQATNTFQQGVITNGMDAGGAHVRLVYGNYGTMLRNDGTTTYFLATNSGAQDGTFNNLRPFYFNNATGVVGIDNGGAGVTIGVAGGAPIVVASPLTVQYATAYNNPVALGQINPGMQASSARAYVASGNASVSVSFTAPGPGILIALGNRNNGEVIGSGNPSTLYINGVQGDYDSSPLTMSHFATQTTTGGAVSAEYVTSLPASFSTKVTLIYIPSI